MHMKDHIASVELYGIIGVTSAILEKTLSGILGVLCWVCLQGRYEIDGGEDGRVDSPSVKKERPDNALDTCFLAGAENGRVVGSGILDLGIGEHTTRGNRHRVSNWEQIW